MGQGKSTLAVTVIENINHECENEGCKEKFPFGELASHGKCCVHRPVKCPALYCDYKVSLSLLPAHIESCSNCGGDKIESFEMPHVIDYKITDEHEMMKRDGFWDVEFMRYDGQIFGMKVARCKVSGKKRRWVFMVQMVGGEEETAKYGATIIVHRTNDDPDGNYSLRYHGDICPIDVTTVQAADEKGMCLTLTDGAMNKFLVDAEDSMDSSSEKDFSVAVDIRRRTP